MNRAEVYRLIDAERERQSKLWTGPHAWGHGDCSSRHVPSIVKATVLHEESGEVARAVLDGNNIQLIIELVQVAAVAWLEGTP